MRNMFLLGFLGLAACGGGGGPGGRHGTPGGGGGGVDPGGPIDNNGQTCTKMDILFVVDNSGSMAEEQANLGKNFPLFIDVLNAFKTAGGSDLDWRAGVTTTGKDVSYTIDLGGLALPMTEKGENGHLQQKCGMTRRWIERNDNVDVAQQFACLANQGTMGSSLEMPLEGMRMALVDRVKDGSNAGFLRDDALLAVVFMTDEEDCSRSDNNFSLPNGICNPKDETPVSQYVSTLDTVAHGKGRWAVAAIAGPGPGACMSSFGSADENTRLRELVTSAGQNGIFSSICSGDLAQGLKDALQTFSAACESFPPIK